MSVESQISKVVYSGNGATTVFPVPFPYSRPEHLKVMITRADETREETGNFKLELFETGDTNVVYPLTGDPLASGERLTVFRQTPRTQILDLIYGGAFSPETLETDGFDRLCMMVQELGEETGRAVRIPIDSTEDASLDKVFAQLASYQTACEESAGQASETLDETREIAARLPGYQTTCEEKAAETSAALAEFRQKMAGVDQKTEELETLFTKSRTSQSVTLSGYGTHRPGNEAYIYVESGSPAIMLEGTLQAYGYWFILVGNSSGVKLKKPVTGSTPVDLASLEANTMYVVIHMGQTSTFFLLQLNSGNTLLRA